MKVFRCITCGKILFEASLIEGTIKKKCKCGAMNTIKVTKPANQSFQDRLDLAKK